MSAASDNVRAAIKEYFDANIPSYMLLYLSMCHSLCFDYCYVSGSVTFYV